ncbi:MAG: phage portal protein family protein [Candidatus Acidiferrales bacterium]
MPEPQAIPKQPQTGELVTNEVLASVGTNPVAFSGADNPSAAWRLMLGDSPAAYALYRDLEEKDGQVSSALETRKDGVLRRERKVVAASATADDERRATFAREVLAAIPNFENILYELLDAAAYGFSVAEILWEQDGSAVFIRDIKPRPQELFAFGETGAPHVGALRFSTFSRRQAPPGSARGEALLPEHKFLVYSFRPRHGNRRGRPLLRRVFWASWFKRQDLKFWLKFIEKGTGSVVVRYPAGATDQDKQRALEAAEAINAETAVAIPENFQIATELLNAARAGDTDVFLTLADTICNNEIARVILGQTLTQRGGEDGRGSRALGEVHQEVRFEKVAADARDLMSVVNDQLLRWLFLFNFGPDVPTPHWTIALDPPEDLRQRIEIDERLARLGAPLPLGYLQRTYSIPAPQVGETALSAPGSESE